jgi:hypothetical protein
VSISKNEGHMGIYDQNLTFSRPKLSSKRAGPLRSPVEAESHMSWLVLLTPKSLVRPIEELGSRISGFMSTAFLFDSIAAVTASLAFPSALCMIQRKEVRYGTQECGLSQVYL